MARPSNNSRTVWQGFGIFLIFFFFDTGLSKRNGAKLGKLFSYSCTLCDPHSDNFWSTAFLHLIAFSSTYHRQCVVRRSRCWCGSDNVRPLDLITVRSRNGTKKSRNQSWCDGWWWWLVSALCVCTVVVLCGEHGRGLSASGASAKRSSPLNPSFWYCLCDGVLKSTIYRSRWKRWKILVWRSHPLLFLTFLQHPKPRILSKSNVTWMQFINSCTWVAWQVKRKKIPT